MNPAVGADRGGAHGPHQPIANSMVRSSPRARRRRALSPSWFINAELSWLDFNERVLEELDASTRSWSGSGSWRSAHQPRRVLRGPRRWLQASTPRTSSRRTHLPTAWALVRLFEITRRAANVTRLWELAHREVVPYCKNMASCSAHPQELTDAQNAFLDDYFGTQVYPVLTPLAIDPASPPHVHNRA